MQWPGLSPVEIPRPAAPDSLPPTGPLPLTAFERLVLRFDRPGSSMVFRVIMRFAGSIDSDLLISAYRSALRRQPLLSSRVADQSGKLFWEPVPDPPDLILHPFNETAPRSAEQALTPLDLSQTSGLRTEIWPHRNGLTINLDFHHACCDGQGARQFLADWFLTADHLSQGTSSRMPRQDPARLASRGQLSPSLIGFRENLRNIRATLSGKTARLPIENQACVNLPRLAERSWSIDDTEQIRRRLRQARLTINDLGLTCCFAACAESFPQACAGRALMIFNPVDLRRSSDARCPACNRLGVALIRRRANWNSDSELLRGLHEEMQYVKQRNIGAEFLHGLQLVSRIPGGIAGMEALGWLTPTLQFTCLGDTTRGVKPRPASPSTAKTFGDLHLQEIAGFAPFVPGVPLSIALCETNNRMNLTLRADPRFLTSEQVEAFADTFRKRMTGIVNLLPEDGT